MYANYHSHTYRCNHAVGTAEEYIKKAISVGIKEWGFSDHVPYIFPENYISACRMRPDQAKSYVEEVVELREKYKDQIKIYVGYEAEYLPDEFERMLEFISQYEVDYLILGQHFLKNEYDGVYVGRATTDEEILKAYVDQAIAGLSTGKFTYMAHPDVVAYTGSEEIYTREMKRLCEFAKEKRVPLEINMLGLEEGRYYPNETLWKIVKEVGNDVIIGIDAHRPDVISDVELAKKAYAFAEKFDITPLQRVNLIPVK